MSQDNLNPVIPTSRAENYLNNIRLALAAIRTLHSGSSAPTVTSAYQMWADTTTGVLKQRNAADDGWVVVRPLAGTGPVWAAKSSNFVADPEEASGYIVDCSSAIVVATLPPASTKCSFVFKRVDATPSGFTLTIEADSGETIDGDADYDIELQYESVNVSSDGTEWWIY